MPLGRQPSWGSNPLQRSGSGQMGGLQRSTSRRLRPRSPLGDPSGASVSSDDNPFYGSYDDADPAGDEVTDEVTGGAKEAARKRKKRGLSKGASKGKKGKKLSGDASSLTSSGLTKSAAGKVGRVSKLRKLASSEPPTPSSRTPRTARARPASTGSKVLSGSKTLSTLLESASEAEAEGDSAAEDVDSGAEEADSGMEEGDSEAEQESNILSSMDGSSQGWLTEAAPAADAIFDDAGNAAKFRSARTAAGRPERDQSQDAADSGTQSRQEAGARRQHPAAASDAAESQRKTRQPALARRQSALPGEHHPYC